jgi:hypothetical protein
VREGTPIGPILFGGGQEGGLRSGTENVAGIAGLGAAADLARVELDGRMEHETELRDQLIEGLLAMPDVELNGHPERRLSNNAHVSVRGVGAESLVLVLDALGYAVGSGSACSSGGDQPSRLLLALGRDEQDALSAARITVGKDNTARGGRGLPGGLRGGRQPPPRGLAAVREVGSRHQHSARKIAARTKENSLLLKSRRTTSARRAGRSAVAAPGQPEAEA